MLLSMSVNMSVAMITDMLTDMSTTRSSPACPRKAVPHIGRAQARGRELDLSFVSQHGQPRFHGTVRQAERVSDLGSRELAPFQWMQGNTIEIHQAAG